MIRIPRLGGGFKRIYEPSGDVFRGPDTDNLKTGVYYENWIPNDHTLIRDKTGEWHGFGITGPASVGIHEAEWTAFHISSKPGLLQDLMDKQHWTEHPKVLYPTERPNERKELYAPYVIERNDVYHMFYGPTDMRHAVSTDLFTWTPLGTAFTQDESARDPYMFYLDDRYYMVYVASSSVYIRSSPDLDDWSESPTMIYKMPFTGDPESPFIVQYDGWFYLFWCIYDGLNSFYDNRTYVFRSDNPFDFNGKAPVTMLQAHAPEVIQDTDGSWYITTVEWPGRGVWMAPLDWE